MAKVSSCVDVVGSEMFTFNKSTSTFVSDASLFGDSTLCKRLYNDSYDLGFGIKSKRTGNVEYFYESLVKKDSDGDLIFIEYIPVNRKLRLDGVTVKIFNT